MRLDVGNMAAPQPQAGGCGENEQAKENGGKGNHGQFQLNSALFLKREKQEGSLWHKTITTSSGLTWK
jgi:hypothetical protein